MPALSCLVRAIEGLSEVQSALVFCNFESARNKVLPEGQVLIFESARKE